MSEWGLSGTCPQCHLPYLDSVDIQGRRGETDWQTALSGSVCWDLGWDEVDGALYLHPNTVWAFVLDVDVGLRASGAYPSEPAAQEAGPPQKWFRNDDVEADLTELSLEKWMDIRTGGEYSRW